MPLQISFYKPTYRLTPGTAERLTSAPDTYYNVTNILVRGDGSVLFHHFKNGIEEFVICNLPYKIVGPKEEIEQVYRMP